MWHSAINCNVHRQEVKYSICERFLFLTLLPLVCRWQTKWWMNWRDVPFSTQFTYIPSINIVFNLTYSTNASVKFFYQHKIIYVLCNINNVQFCANNVKYVSNLFYGIFQNVYDCGTSAVIFLKNARCTLKTM